MREGEGVRGYGEAGGRSGAGAGGAGRGGARVTESAFEASTRSKHPIAFFSSPDLRCIWPSPKMGGSYVGDSTVAWVYHWSADL